MANFFDQFDEPTTARGAVTVKPYTGPATTAAPAGNFFDQFDEPAAGTSTPAPDMSGFASDLGKLKPQVSQGRAALEGGLSGAGLGFRDEVYGASRASGLPEFLGGLRAPIGAARLAYEALTEPGAATETYRTERDKIREVQQAAQEQHPGTYLGSQIGGSLATAVLPIGLAGRAATTAGTVGRGLGLGVAMGAAQGAGEALELSDVPTEAAIGGGIGGAIGAAVPAVAGAVRRVITPYAIPQTRQAATKVLAREGVPVSAGQQIGNKARGLRYLEDEFGGAAFRDAQAERFTASALKRAGINATHATSDVIDDAFSRIGAEFNSLSASNNVRFTPRLNKALAVIENAYNRDTGSATRAPLIGQVVEDFRNAAAQYGNVPGGLYASTRTVLADTLRGSTDGTLKASAKRLLTEIDDAMERSISHADKLRFKTAREQYRNLIPLSQAAAGAGEQAAEGIITPQRLRQAIVANNGSRAYSRGRGDLSELTRAGNVVMGTLPQSGSGHRVGARIAAQVVGHAIPGVAGAGYGGSTEGAGGAAVGGLAGLTLPHLAAKSALSPIGRRLLTNQALAGPPSYLSGLLGQGARVPALQAYRSKDR